jgi:rhamnosyltransferase
MRGLLMTEAHSQSCSIVIRAYNEERHIGRLLDGISMQNLSDPEIILVDSGSTDHTIEIAARYPVKIVRIPPQEFSFGRSLNLGIAASHGELVVISSAHVYPVYPDWLASLLDPFADPKIALAYGKQRGDANTRFSERQVLAGWFPETSTRHQNFPFCNNANAAVRRSLWEQHPYDEALTGLEDLSWARWAMDQGYAIAYVAEAEIVHVHNETPEAVYNRYRREAMAYKHLFPSERFGFGDFLRLSAGNISSDLRHAAHQKCLAHNFFSIFWFRLMQFWGTYQGFRHPGLVSEQLRRTFYYPRDIKQPSETRPREIEPIPYNEP